MARYSGIFDNSSIAVGDHSKKILGIIGEHLLLDIIMPGILGRYLLAA